MRPSAGSAKPSLRVAFISLKNPHYRSLWLSQVASFTGMQMQMVARGLLAFQLTGSYTAVGVVLMAWGIPQLLFSLIGGAVADRVNKRNVVIVAQLGTGLLSLAVAVLISIDQISIPILFGMGLIQGTLFAFNMPARQALLAELVSQRELMNAIALNNVAMNATRIVGPSVAGVLIALWGIEAAYYAQTFTYLFVMGFLFRLPPSTSHLAGAAERGSVVHEIGVGLKYIGSSRTMLLLMLMAFVPTILGMPYISLLPGFAVAELGLEASAYGFMFTVSGIGAIVGSVVIAGMTDFPRKPLLQMVVGLGFGGSLLALGLASMGFGYAGALGALLAIGLFSTTYQTLNNTMIMAESRPEFYGRVMSVYMLTFSVFPLMSGPMGVIADQISGATTFILLGMGIMAFMIAVTLLNPGYIFRRSAPPTYDDEPAAPAGPTVGPAVATAGPAGAPAFASVAAAARLEAAPGEPSAAPARAVASPTGPRRPPRRRDYVAGAAPTPADYMAAPLANGSNGASNGTSSGNGATSNGAGRGVRGRLDRYGLSPAAASSSPAEQPRAEAAPPAPASAPTTYGLPGAPVAAARVYGLEAADQPPPIDTTIVTEVVAGGEPADPGEAAPEPVRFEPRAVAPEPEPAAEPKDEPDEQSYRRTIEAGDAIASTPGPGRFFPSPTEHVRVPALPSTPERGPRLLITAMTASIVTGLLSIVLRGSRGS